MKHFYKKIQNWFDYEDVFDLVLSRAKNGDRFVEIGVWKGGSTAYMGVEILNSRKKIYYDAIDTFSGSTEHGDVSNWLYEETIKNLRPIIKIKIVNIIQGYSLDVVNKYNDESIDFCYIDGSHEYDDVKKDILSYLPKIKKGGIIAGHDYNKEDWKGVVRAVDEIFGEKVVIMRSSWLYFND